MKIQHKTPNQSMSKYTLKLKGLPKFKDETLLHKKKSINKIFIESHIRNLSDKIEIIDINFCPKNSGCIEEV